LPKGTASPPPLPEDNVRPFPLGLRDEAADEPQAVGPRSRLWAFLFGGDGSPGSNLRTALAFAIVVGVIVLVALFQMAMSLNGF
jgi:hypothetical protein